MSATIPDFSASALAKKTADCRTVATVARHAHGHAPHNHGLGSAGQPTPGYPSFDGNGAVAPRGASVLIHGSARAECDDAGSASSDAEARGELQGVSTEAARCRRLPIDHRSATAGATPARESTPSFFLPGQTVRIGVSRVNNLEILARVDRISTATGMIYLTDAHGGDRVCFPDELVRVKDAAINFVIQPPDTEPRRDSHPHYFVDLAKKNVRRRRAHLGASGDKPVVREQRRQPVAVPAGRIRMKDAAKLAGVSGALLAHHVSTGALTVIRHSHKCATFDEAEFRVWLAARNAGKEAAKTVPGLTVAEVCALTNAEAATVRSAAQEGRLHGTKAGIVWRFQLNEVERWNRENRHTGYKRKGTP